MPLSVQHQGYTLSDDPARIDAGAVHAYLSRSYWAEKMPLAVLERALAHSLCVGIYDSSGAQVGLVRIVTDRATFAYLCDVYVLEPHRRAGLSKAALAFVKSHPDLQQLRRWQLATKDAHGLYAQFGFVPLSDPLSQMEIRDPEVYLRAGRR